MIRGHQNQKLINQNMVKKVNSPSQNVKAQNQGHQSKDKNKFPRV